MDVPAVDPEDSFYYDIPQIVETLQEGGSLSSKFWPMAQQDYDLESVDDQGLLSNDVLSEENGDFLDNGPDENRGEGEVKFVQTIYTPGESIPEPDYHYYDMYYYDDDYTIPEFNGPSFDYGATDDAGAGTGPHGNWLDNPLDKDQPPTEAIHDPKDTALVDSGWGSEGEQASEWSDPILAGQEDNHGDDIAMDLPSWMEDKLNGAGQQWISNNEEAVDIGSNPSEQFQMQAAHGMDQTSSVDDNTGGHEENPSEHTMSESRGITSGHPAWDDTIINESGVHQEGNMDGSSNQSQVGADPTSGRSDTGTRDGSSSLLLTGPNNKEHHSGDTFDRAGITSHDRQLEDTRLGQISGQGEQSVRSPVSSDTKTEQSRYVINGQDADPVNTDLDYETDHPFYLDGYEYVDDAYANFDPVQDPFGSGPDFGVDVHTVPQAPSEVSQVNFFLVFCGIW